MKHSNEERTVSFYKVYQPMIKTHGCDTAVLIAAMAAKQGYMYRFGKQDGAGYFYFEHPEIEKETKLSEYRQKAAMKILTELKLLTIAGDKRGTPPKKFYKVDTSRYESYVQELDEKYRNEKPVRRNRKFK